MAEGSSSSSDTGDSRCSGDGDRNLADSVVHDTQHVDPQQQVPLEITSQTAQQMSWHDRHGGHASETEISQWQQGAHTGNQHEILGLATSNHPLNLQGMEPIVSVNVPHSHVPLYSTYQDQSFERPHLARFANQPTAGAGSLRFDSLSNSNGNSLESQRMGLLYQGDVQRSRPKLLANRRENSEEELFTRGILFDMSKVNKIAYGEVKKFRSCGATLSEQATADILKIRMGDVKVLVDKTLPVGCPSRNIVIIAPNARKSREFILVESLVHQDQKYPELLCLRITNNGKRVNVIASDIAREMSVKNVVICENNQLLLNDMLVTNENGPFRRFKAVRNTKISLVFLHQPSQNVQSRFVLESDTGINIDKLREEFLQIHKTHIMMGDNDMLHFSYDNKFLEGSLCIGTISWPKRELKMGIHIALSTAICAKLLYKEYTAIKGVPSFKECAIAIEPSLSTAQLRQEVSKYTGKDPKAIKISINGRRVEEMDYLNELGNDLVNGCTLEAGVKKKKLICVRDSKSNRTESFSLYMLEPVRVLKEMIANSFGLESLHVSLEYKGRQLDNDELLVNYPIKNRTQVKMDVFAHRIKFHVYIAFKKIRTTLIVDNVNKSTIDDLLRFCASTFQFDRRCARVQFHGRCLSRFSTLAQERIPSNDTLVVVFFDQPAKLKGGLITIYTGRADGQINVRLGAVSGGVLLHASKKVKPESSESLSNREERVPEGISVCEEHQVTDRGEEIIYKRKPELKERITHPDFLTVSERNALRRKFIGKARKIRRNILTTQQQPPQVRPELRSLESRHFGYDSSAGSQNLVTPAYSSCSYEVLTPHRRYDTSADSLNLPLGLESSDSETELKTLRTRQGTNPSPPEDDGGSIDHDEPPGLDIPVGLDIPLNHDVPINFGKSREVEQRLECIKNCCQNIDKLIHSTPRDSSDSCNEELHNIDVINPDSVIAEEQSKDRGMPVFGDTSGSASDLLQAAATRNVEFYLDTESSDHENGQQLMWNNQRALLHDRLQSMQSVVPYRMGRRRTMTEGDTDLFVYRGNTNMELHRNTTFPVSRLEDDRNAWLNTAGITVEILTGVGRKIGKQWKKLARKLSVAEEEIDNIEDKKNDLHDKACDALVYWKKSKGAEASRERLIQALREIEMAAVAEFVEEISQNYYQTV